MATFDRLLVGDLIARCRTAGLSAAERGKALEDLVDSVFSAVPGVQVHARNVKSVFENEELDLGMTNLQESAGLPTVGTTFLVECKNWSSPVGSLEFCWFATKLRRSHQSFGVLVSTHGVTGDPARLTAANFEAATALAEGQQVVVLTLGEIEMLVTGEQLARLLHEKQLRLITRREIFVSESLSAAAFLAAGGRGRHATTDRDRIIRDLATVRVEERPIEQAAQVLWRALAEFEESEAGEPQAGAADNASDFDAWSESNLELFERVEAAVLGLANACIGKLQARPGKQWDGERLPLGVDIQAPRQLFAAPDSDLARLLVTHWAKESASDLQYVADGATLCLLGLAAEWLFEVREGGWPQPWV